MPTYAAEASADRAHRVRSVERRRAFRRSTSATLDGAAFGHATSTPSPSSRALPAGGLYAALTAAPGVRADAAVDDHPVAVVEAFGDEPASPFHSPTATGRSSAWFCALTTQTKWPFALCCTARCGTTTAFGRIAPFRRTRTYWFGRSTPGGIVDRRAQQERAGRRVVRRVREGDRTGVREEVAVDHLDLDDELSAVRAA